MKKYIIYIGILAIGLLLGWVLFGGSSNNEKVYNLFCHMADSNKGAYWLSKEQKVANPYFGDAMLTCGEVKQTIE